MIVNELPRSKLRGIKPPLAYNHGPASLAGWMLVYRVDVLYVLHAHLRTTPTGRLGDAVQLRITFCTALLLNILAHDFFIPMTAYRTDEITFGPTFATPQTLFDGRDAVKYLTSRETFDRLDNLGRAITRRRLHQKMDMIFVSANF
jgi:hypothetical protein